MTKQSQTIRTKTIDDIAPELRELIHDVSRGTTRVLIEQGGCPVVAIISAADLERFNHYEQERAQDFAAFREISDAFADVPLDELEREIERAICEVRQERREQAGAGRQE